MNMSEVEQAARQAWPALEELELSYGVLRYARGIDRRANSLSIFPEAKFDPVLAIGKAEMFFAQRGADSIVRILRPPSSSLPAVLELDRILDARGYERQSPTLTMLLKLNQFPALSSPEAADRLYHIEAWLKAWYGLTARDVDGIDVHLNALGRLEPSDCVFLHRLIHGKSASTGMGVLSGKAIGLFGIATAPSARQQGHATAVIDSLLCWGKKKKAKFAYLQVEETNTAAIELYKKIGFKESYSYWYRVAGNRIED